MRRDLEQRLSRRADPDSWIFERMPGEFALREFLTFDAHGFVWLLARAPTGNLMARDPDSIDEEENIQPPLHWLTPFRPWNEDKALRL
jgi:hypothetical protein